MRAKKIVVCPNPRKHRRVNPDWTARMAERENRISEREARKDQQFEKLFEALGLLAANLNSKAEPPNFVKAPDYICGLYVDGVRAAQIIGLPALRPAQELLADFVEKHIGAREFQLVLTRIEEEE